MERLLAPQPVAPAMMLGAAYWLMLATTSAPQPRNVLLITADSLRADAVDYRKRGRTPALAALAASGTRFNRAFTVTPWTAPALVSIFTGLYPPTHGVVHRDDTTPRTLPTLPRLLGARGYTLANFGFFTGASYYRNLGLPEPAVNGVETLASQALIAWLQAAQFQDRAPATPFEPFFAWIHYIEPHMPYGAGGYQAANARVLGSSALERVQTASSLPLGAGLAFVPGEAASVRALYREDVELMDRALGSVLEALRARGLLERTLVVFTADHGEELLEHGWVGHASTRGETHLTEQEVRIPLIVAGPGVPAGRRSGALAQNVDVAPTILELLGISSSAPEMQGVSLVKAFAGGAVRSRVFFDTTPGGHLTPAARAGERLQGVGDGKRIHAERLGGASSAADPRTPALVADLVAWRNAQAAARVQLLAQYAGAVRPPPAEVAGYAETLVVDAPDDAARLEWRAAGGQVALRWQGATASYWIEYELFGGIAGAFSVEEPRLAVGPFPLAFWNDLARYSPFRFRVLDVAGRARSSWRTLSLVVAP